MAAAGCTVTVATMGWGDLPAAETLDGGVAVVRLPCGRRRREAAGALEALRWAWQAARWARRRHLEEPFDAVHAHFVVPGGLAAAALRRAPGTRLPFILTPHGTDVPGYDPRRFRVTHRVIRPVWRRVCRSAHALVSPSWNLRGLIAAAGAGRDAQVIPNPVDTRRFRPGVKERRILLCGRLVERKGFAPLLAALRGVELPGWEIDVVGDGPERPALEGLASRLALPVRFHGWIAQTDPRLATIFGRAALFVFPSPWENLPVVLLEAMAAGCAVVSTDAPGNLEAVGEAAVRVAVGDGPGLAQAVAELAADAGARDDLGRRARARAEETFDSRVVARRYLDLLRAAAGGGP
jgi:glycosyltransferase involved in cell wall biosynthesis